MKNCYLERDMENLDKKNFRQQMKKQINENLCCPLFSFAGKNALFHLENQEIYYKAHTILTFLPTSEEIETREIIENAEKRGKDVGVPLVLDGNQMEFRLLSKDIPLEDQIEEGAFGIREPKKNCLKWEPYKEVGPVLILVPGLAFSLNGKRLGKGKGFYDRFLSTLPPDLAVTKLGFCYSFQLNNSIPTQIHDVQMDGLLTEKTLILFDNFEKTY